MLNGFYSSRMQKTHADTEYHAELHLAVYAGKTTHAGVHVCFWSYSLMLVIAGSNA